MSTAQEYSTQQADHKEGQLRAILYLLQTYFEERKDEVDRSYDLLQIGEKTPLSKKIEDSIDRPLESLFEVAHGMGESMKAILDDIVKAFLVYNKASIQSAYRTKTAFNDLHYSIILTEDTLEVRDCFLEFYDFYYQIDENRQYPVYFQFIAAEREDKIRYIEKIELEAA